MGSPGGPDPVDPRGASRELFFREPNRGCRECVHREHRCSLVFRDAVGLSQGASRPRYKLGDQLKDGDGTTRPGAPGPSDSSTSRESEGRPLSREGSRE